ncbi:MAG TPA: S8 family serine peptidase, partial [Flavitalea sp.]|nr:S8 family serine peptidase [Flavitalea sp.]
DDDDHDNDGYAFELEGASSVPAGSYVWLGNVWAPNGAISVDKTSSLSNGSAHIIGALWSGKKVDIKNDIKIVYQGAAVGTGLVYIEPYIPPPANGKVTTANNVIGAELLSLSQNTTAISAIPENELFILDGTGKVMIEVISKQANDNTLRTQLVALGMTGIVNNGPHIYTITGLFPINRITQLNGNTRIDYVRPLYPPISNTGLIPSQGDITMRSNSVRERFGLGGSNIKIGVISDSYDAKQGAQTDVNEGDLPGIKSNGQPGENPDPVQVLEDLAQRGNDEGRAMLQIVHDVAPKAKLAFHTGFLSAGHFAAAIQKLASPSLPGGRCDVIVDDLTYITEPFQRDGVVAQAVNQVVSQGVAYFTSAGNFGNKSYEAVFSGVTNTAVIPTGQIHKFGANATDIYQTINLKPGSYTIALQWSDEFSSLGSVNGVQTDLDLYLVSANGFQLFGFNRSNLFGDPFEVCAFTVKDETNAKLMIVRAAGTANVRFKYIIFRGEPTILDYQTGTSTVVGHANADSAISVGAMLYGNVPPFTPVWPGVASFSSRGGTVTLRNNTFSTRNKPDLIGPNGVNTSVNLGGAPFNDGDIYPNFFGTSAAAPHVAAVAGLLIEGRKKFNLQTTVSPYEIRQQLISSAGKFSYLPGNFSFEGGYGYVQADSAMVKIANARPIISTLAAVNPGAQNGTQPFMVKITGKYLTSTTQIYVNNSPVPTNISIDPATGIGTATTTVPAILNGQDPAFQL